jgi:hypothetical protein
MWMNSELDGLNKSQLFYLERKLNELPKQKNTQINNELKSKKKKVRAYLYECRYCADAKMKPKYDRYTKTMDEDFQSPCDAKVCPYRHHFEEMAITEGGGINLTKFLKKYLKNFSE